MHKDLLQHTVQMALHFQSTTEMKDRTNGLGQDMLSMYDQDALLLLVSVVKVDLVRLEFDYRFLLAISK
jgi:hypothetical protein